MSNNLPLETSHPNEEEAASPFTSEKITNDTQQRKSQHNVNRDENSCRMPQKEPSNLWQKETPESGNHASQLIEVSPAIKQEPYDLQRRQSSDARHDVSGFHEEERAFSCKYENDADILMQNQTPNPWVPVQESNVPLVKAVEKLYPGMNLEEGIHRSQSDEGSIPSKVPPDLLKIPKDEPDNLRLRQSPYSGVQTSEMCDGERTSSVKRDMVSVALQPVQDFRGALASQSDKQKLIYSTRPEKAMEKLQPRRNPDNGGCSSQSDQVIIPSTRSEELSIIPKEEPHPNSLQPRQCLDARNHALLSTEEKCTSMKREKVSENLVVMSSLSVGVPLPQPDQENFSYSTKFEKVEKLQPRRNPDPVVQGSQSDAESTPSKVPEKGLDDGYNWRKYGQKLVKGNKFIRSYYKCTYPNCQAKKQVERSHDGSKTDVNYLGDHQHPKPQHSPQVSSTFQVRSSEIPIASASKTDAEPIIDDGGSNQNMTPTVTLLQSTVARSAYGVTDAVSCSNNDKDAKRQKREITSGDDNVVNKPNSDLRHVVQTLSDVDIVNDGYRWRKYGQKLVKGNPNPRSYYRCSNAGCAVKKHVERASHDSKVVITTYEGQHDHDMPPSRTVSQSTATSDANIMTTNGESRPKPESTVRSDANIMTTNGESRPKPESTVSDANIMTTNGESRPKPEENSPVGLEMVVHVSSTEQ